MRGEEFVEISEEEAEEFNNYNKQVTRQGLKQSNKTQKGHV